MGFGGFLIFYITFIVITGINGDNLNDEQQYLDDISDETLETSFSIAQILANIVDETNDNISMPPSIPNNTSIIDTTPEVIMKDNGNNNDDTGVDIVVEMEMNTVNNMDTTNDDTVPNINLAVKPNTVCSDLETLCPGHACCMMNSGKYGCCPYPNGVCCPNKKQCCPKGYECIGWPNKVRSMIEQMFGFQTEIQVRCRLNIKNFLYETFIKKQNHKYG